MSQPTPDQLTAVLARAASGERSASDQLMPLVYDQLRALAQSYLRQQSSGHTLQATALVHEAYIRLLGGRQIAWESRAHFFDVAARAMRQVLCNHARDLRRVKRGSGRARITLSEADTPSGASQVDLVDLDDALTELAELDERQSRIVELRFFSGMTVEEVVQVLGVSTTTVEREWRAARAWLSSVLRPD